MRAKFKAEGVTNYAGYYNGEKTFQQQEVVLRAVTGGTKEDNQFNAATPSGEIKMRIDEPSAIDFIKPGKSYYIDITEAD